MRAWFSRNRTTLLRLLISFGAAAGIGVRIWKPDLKIDAVSLGLIVIVLVPWLGRIFRTIKLPGGFEVEYPDFDKVAADIPDGPVALGTVPAGQPSYLQVRSLDPNLALVGLRIEVEALLVRLWEKTIEGGEAPRSARRLLHDLRREDSLPPNVAGALDEILGAGNMAAHGVEPPPGAHEFAFDEGPRVLAYLRRLVEEV